jgi:putative endonuclease
MYYVYVLKSKRFEKVYVGYSEDLRRRLDEHNSGKVKSTKAFRPWILVYYESYLSKKDARKREINLKEHKPKSDLLSQIRDSLDEVSK